MTKNLQLTFICSLFVGCSSAQDCNPSINLLPMYGNIPKCKEQLQSDKKFIAFADLKFKDRKTASLSYIKLGWDYYYKNDPETAMKRFNQAWLLDSLNADIYWGFGNLLGKKGELKASIPYFEKSLRLNQNNSKVYEGLAISYCLLFDKTRDLKILNKAIETLRKADSLDKNNPRILAQLTTAYSYYVQKDSAYKYLSLTDKIDPTAIHPEVRALLKKR
jgi:tetratricopeptide (TPR) repeat protein